MSNDISLEELIAEQEKAAKARAEAKQNREEGKVVVNLNNAPPLYYPPKGSIEFIARPVVPFDKFYTRLTHTFDVDSKTGKRTICLDHFREACPDCISTTEKSGKQFPRPTLFGLWEILNLRAEPKQTFYDKEKKEDVTVTLNKFVRRLEIPFGKDKANYNALKAIADDDEYVKFTDRFILFKKTSGEPWSVPLNVSKKQVIELFGPEMAVDMLPQSKVYMDLPMRQLKKYYLTGFTNLNEERLNTLLGPEEFVSENPENPFENTEKSNVVDIAIDF